MRDIKEGLNKLKEILHFFCSPIFLNKETQFHFYQNLNRIFNEAWQTNPKTHMKEQRTKDDLDNSKEDQNGRRQYDDYS